MTIQEGDTLKTRHSSYGLFNTFLFLQGVMITITSQNPKTMSRILSLFVLLILTFPTFAQDDVTYMQLMREVLQLEKKAVIEEVMQLTSEESTAFWPLYEEFTQQKQKVADKRIQTILDYADAYENMTNEKAEELWKSATKTRKEMNKLEEKYFKKFKKILPAGKAVLYFQAESKINALIDASLASEIPFIEIKE